MKRSLVILFRTLASDLLFFPVLEEKNKNPVPEVSVAFNIHAISHTPPFVAFVLGRGGRRSVTSAVPS